MVCPALLHRLRTLRVSREVKTSGRSATTGLGLDEVLVPIHIRPIHLNPRFLLATTDHRSGRGENFRRIMSENNSMVDHAEVRTVKADMGMNGVANEDHTRDEEGGVSAAATEGADTGTDLILVAVGTQVEASKRTSLSLNTNPKSMGTMALPPPSRPTYHNLASTIRILPTLRLPHNLIFPVRKVHLHHPCLCRRPPCTSR